MTRRESPMDIATHEEDIHDLQNTRMSKYTLTRDLVGRAWGQSTSIYGTTYSNRVSIPIIATIKEVFNPALNILSSSSRTKRWDVVVLWNAVLCLCLEPAPESWDAINELCFIQSLWKDSTVLLTVCSMSGMTTNWQSSLSPNAWENASLARSCCCVLLANGSFRMR